MHSGHCYCSSAHGEPYVAGVIQIRGLFASQYDSLSPHKTFKRRFSVAVPASEQMNLIKLLREQTSAPIKSVKSALVDSNWDIEAAQKDLRKNGVVLASKKSSRTAAEGLLALVQNESKALFLARIALSVDSSADQTSTAIPIGSEYLECLKINLDHPKLSGEGTVQSAIAEVAAMVGENVKLRRGFQLSSSAHGILSSYLQTSPQSGLGRIAGILTLEMEADNVQLDALQEVGSQPAMHIVSAKPLFLSRELVSNEAIESE